MPTTRGLERLIFFTDAVVAIAITLLILPLVDAASEPENTAKTAAHFFTEERQQILAFLISFAVIARLWVAHHSLFEHVASYSRRILLLNLAWAFTIVVLPLPTAMSAEFDTEALTIAFYLGTMLLSSLMLTLLALTIRGDASIEESARPIGHNAVQGSAVMTVLFALALVVGVFVPGVAFWALLLLLLAGPIEAVLNRRAARLAHSRDA
ncbi:TMEM175 family protein [Mycetocola zhadangensis]|uniref:TMEM175 family protein n=1 Tax=Mycetocola zhadangensis TaxID=1164595 RepID=UPI003A4DB6F2